MLYRYDGDQKNKLIRVAKRMEQANRSERTAASYSLPHRTGNVEARFTIDQVVWQTIRFERPSLDRAEVTRLAELRLKRGWRAHQPVARVPVRVRADEVDLARQVQQARREARRTLLRQTTYERKFER
jgi:hypothetical protein